MKAKEKPLRVLVVDDSAFMRKKISQIINDADDMEVCATAKNGEEALKAVAYLNPDVITLDMVMPVMDGATCLKYIMSEWPTPVIMLSAQARECADDSLAALDAGAFDWVAKPDGREISMSLEGAAGELIDKIRVAGRVNAGKLKTTSGRERSPLTKSRGAASNFVVAVGASTGGPRAVASFFLSLPADVPAAFLVVQHMPAEFTGSFAARLNRDTPFRVEEARAGVAVETGVVYVGRGGHSLRLERKTGRPVLVVEKGGCAGRHCPSVDEMMSSVAKVCGADCVGLVLTGMGCDGREGLRNIQAAGGTTLAQDETSCIVYGMPRACVEAGVVDRVVSLDEAPAVLMKLVTARMAERKGT